MVLQRYYHGFTAVLSWCYHGNTTSFDSVFSCRFDCEDPFDCFNFELDTCTYCNHLQQRNKMSFNKKMKNC
eukprot:UN21759